MAPRVTVRIDPARSRMMSQVRSKNTGPEMIVRSLLHRLGYRFRLHRKDLPGKPDIVLPSRRFAVFVHGCFWHAHQGCRKATMPKTRGDFWSSKIGRNVERDAENIVALRKLGWRTMVVWECETGPAVEAVLSRRLKSGIVHLLPRPVRAPKSDSGIRNAPQR